MKEQHRVVIYLPKKDYQRLRAKLILMGKSVSGWFRDKVKTFLET